MIETNFFCFSLDIFQYKGGEGVTKIQTFWETFFFFFERRLKKFLAGIKKYRVGEGVQAKLSMSKQKQIFFCDGFSLKLVETVFFLVVRF